MLDPAASPSCRVWTAACPACGAQPPEGVYLLGYTVAALFCQCPACEHRWHFDSGFGVGDRPETPQLWWPTTPPAASA